MRAANSDPAELIEQAKMALQSEQGSAKALLVLGKELRKIEKFDLARRVLALASKQPAAPEVHGEIVQKHASCTEKDPDLPLDCRHQMALDIIEDLLVEAESYLNSRPAVPGPERDEMIGFHQETFGIAGAIHKRWWQVDTQVSHLVRAQELYEKGWKLATYSEGLAIPDQGYTGINAAYVLDLLADQVTQDRELVRQRQEKARAIRLAIRDRQGVLPPEKRSDWWSLVTLAEACFGLGEYREREGRKGAADWLSLACGEKEREEEPWEYETTLKQLAGLAIIQSDVKRAANGIQTSEAWDVLKEFAGGDGAGLATIFSGKVGLALSGGGFRASLFHIGVLARLAELDMLRHVEVISCVSGGSIIGALYYLRLRNLLESRPDSDITRECYVQLVHEMEGTFLRGIQSNPRMKVFSKLHLVGQRTEAMGKLLDETFYGPAAGLDPGVRPELRNLRISPEKEGAPFVPKHHNWRRSNKVPVLILNATSLNTGHNWQFTASFMGESPNQIIPEVDGNERLRRMYFHEKMPEQYKNLPLGLAVAASAAVPGLFRPVRLPGLYPDRSVELVDGGVQDNQGIGGLLEQDCRILMVSDASGQLVAEPHPARWETSVLMRSNNTLMSRVRELEYREIEARKKAGLLREILFLHLKKELAVEPVDWLECDLKKEATKFEGVPPNSSENTHYNVRGDVQNLLAGIRTDLDAFSEAEAWALMSSGYRMTTHYFPHSIESFELDPAKTETWDFQRVDPFLSSTPEQTSPEPCQISEFLDRLKLAGQLLFKAPEFLPLFVQLKEIVRSGIGPSRLVLVLAGSALLAALLWALPFLVWPLLGALLFVIVFVIFSGVGGLYGITCLFDQLYLREGSLKRLLRPRRRTGPPKS